MAKPIFLIKLNSNVPPDKGQQVQDKVKNTLGDEYHVLVACVLSTGTAEFECFNAERLPESSIEEIKEALQ